MINIYKTRIKSPLSSKSRYYIEDSIKDNLLYLRQYVDVRDANSISLYNELLDKLIVTDTYSEVENLFKKYSDMLEKNAYKFIVIDNLTSLCDGYWDNYLEKMFKEVNDKLDDIDFEDSNKLLKLYSYYVSKIVLRKNIITYKMKLQKIITSNPNVYVGGLEIDNLDKCETEEEAREMYIDIYNKLKSRVEYSLLVSSKIDNFIDNCMKDSKNSYTIPYIKSRTKDLYKYYNADDNSLYVFDNCLKNLEREVKYQRQRDQIKAALKKFKIEHQLLEARDEGIIPRDVLNDLRIELRKINTFGGFASLKNKIAEEELLESINSTSNILKRNNSVLKKDKTIKNRKLRQSLVDQAFVALDRIRKQVNTKMDRDLLKSELMYLSMIDYVNDDVDDIVISILV